MLCVEFARSNRYAGQCRDTHAGRERQERKKGVRRHGAAPVRGRHARAHHNVEFKRIQVIPRPTERLPNLGDTVGGVPVIEPGHRRGRFSFERSRCRSEGEFVLDGFRDGSVFRFEFEERADLGNGPLVRRGGHTFVNASCLRALEDDSGGTGRDWRRGTLTIATRRLDQPTEIPNQTDECGEKRDLRGTVAARVLEFRAAALSIGQCREKPPFRGVVRIRQPSHQIGPRMRQCLGLSQAVGYHLEPG